MCSRTLLGVVALSLGCASQPRAASVCGSARVEVSVSTAPEQSEVDVLIVLDGSPSMNSFAPDVVAPLRDLIRVLASGDRNADGIRDFTPAHRLHVAVIDTDMGTGATSGAPACGAGSGDDGRFLTRGTGVGSCETDYVGARPSGVFTFTAGRDDPDAFATDVGCVLGAVSSGCGYSRAVDAILAALDAGRDTGFLSSEAVLAILVVTAQDDCSTTQPEIFASVDPFGAVTPGLRCNTFDDQLRPVDEIATKLLALRPGRPERLVLGVASGVPMSLVGRDFATILADPALDPHADVGNPDRLAAACTRSSDGAIAFPATRWARIAQAVTAAGAGATLESICVPATLSALGDGYVSLLPGHTYGLCLPRPLDTDADGLVSCELTMTLPPIGTTVEAEHCADLPSPEAFSLDHLESVLDPVDGTLRSREVCRVRQVGYAGAGVDAGWAYDDGSAALMPGWSYLPPGCDQRAGMSLSAWGDGVEVRIVCDERILSSTRGAPQRGSPCTPATGMTVGTTPVSCTVGHAIAGDGTSGSLTCDAFDRSCQLACATDADCAGAGLPGMRCDQRSALDYFPDGVPSGIDPGALRLVCVDPSCP